LVDYPGITDLMDNRAVYLSTYPGFQGAPTISNISNVPQTITMGGNVSITAQVADGDTVILAYRYASSELFTKVFMLDDGSQNDGAAGDGVFGYELSSIGNVVQYYIYAENDSAGMFAPQRAAYEYYTLQTQILPGSLVINEFMPLNYTTAFDESGDYDDWIELYNNSAFDISTDGLYLSDTDSSLTKWAMPSVYIPAGGYLIVWADDETSEGALHTNFKLSSIGEQVLLSYNDSTVIDSFSYPPQNPDVALARFPNGTGSFVSRTPTFNANNDYVSVTRIEGNSEFKLYPNPAKGEVYIEVKKLETACLLDLIDINGRVLRSTVLEAYTGLNSIDISSYPQGIYLIRLTQDNVVSTQKLIIY